MEQKSFQDLNLSNAFLFSTAMEDPMTCRLALECILGQEVGKVEVRAEYNVLYNSDFKYIRLDVFGKDELEVSYDLEMQRQNTQNLPKRSRYYQAELDMASLKPGEDYENLKPLYVIFICDFDPFDENLYCYTFEMQCVERRFSLNDGAKRIFLNIRGENKEEVSKTLVEFLGYLNNSTDSYIENVRDEKVREIHKNISILKRNRNLGARYMYLQEYLDAEIKAGIKAGIEEQIEERIEERMKETLREMVEILCEIFPDAETVYQKVITKEAYKHLTKEQVEEIYRQVITEANTNQ